MTQPANSRDIKHESKMNVLYDGSLVRQGRMSAVDVGNAIIGMANIVSSSSRVLYGDGSRVTSVVETNFSRGSFEINFVVEAAGLFGEDTSINQLLVLLFGAGHRGLFGLIKLAAGRKVTRRETRALIDNRVTIQIEGDDNTIIIDRKLDEMYNDRGVREAAEATVKPLKRDGVDTMKISKFRNDADTLSLPDVTISENEVKFFQAPSVTGKVVHRSESEALLRLVSPSFQRGNKWKVAHGDAVFFVDIVDESVLAKVRRYEITFGAGDELIVDMVTETRRISGESKVFRTITHVKDHKTPQHYRQMEEWDES